MTTPATKDDVANLRQDLAMNTKKTDQVLELLRGPLEAPHEGLVHKVADAHERINHIDETHTAVRRWAWGAIGAAITSGVAAAAAAIFGKGTHQ